MNNASQESKRRRGRVPSPRLNRPDVPWTMRLADGRTLVVEVPGRWTTTDRDGSLAFLPDAVRFIDRVQVLCAEIGGAPSPGYITTLREALGLTQAQMGKRLGVNKLTISRWERGTLRPSAKSVGGLRALRHAAVRHGVLLAG